MDVESLLRRKTAIENRWAELQDELKRLQGEHRLVVDLLKPEIDKPKRIRRKVVEEPDAEA